jgi:hypothetical protein
MQASLRTHGIFRNPVTLYGVSVSVAVMVLVVYAPFLQASATQQHYGTRLTSLKCHAHRPLVSYIHLCSIRQTAGPTDPAA